MGAENANRRDYQQLRMRRLLIAVVGYCVISVVFLTYYWAGFARGLSFTGVLLVIFSIMAVNALVFLLICTRINQRFKDPGMTVAQLLIGIFFSTVLCFYMESEIRGSGSLIYTMVFVFGTFGMRLVGLFLLSGMTTGLYAGAMGLLRFSDPGAVSVKLEILRCGILLIALMWISYMAIYIALLRRKIKRMAARDDLTGVLNRREIYERLELEKARCDRGQSPFSLCVLDLDDFKQVNDIYGHQAGDQVLKKFAEMLQKNIRSTDYVGRYGGEEFFVVFVNHDGRHQAHSRRHLERMLALTRQLRFDGIPDNVKMTISAGVTEYRFFESIDSLVSRADQALYRAKSKGKDCIEYSR